jgi:hypothetical protein
MIGFLFTDDFCPSSAWLNICVTLLGKLATGAGVVAELIDTMGLKAEGKGAKNTNQDCQIKPANKPAATIFSNSKITEIMKLRGFID